MEKIKRHPSQTPVNKRIVINKSGELSTFISI